MASLSTLFESPRQLWSWYVTTLVHPSSSSWVAHTAATFKALAFILIAPFLLLTLLDVASYIIARTLGVVHSTGASTSDHHQKDGAHPADASKTVLVPPNACTTPTGTELGSDHAHALGTSTDLAHPASPASVGTTTTGTTTTTTNVNLSTAANPIPVVLTPNTQGHLPVHVTESTTGSPPETQSQRLRLSNEYDTPPAYFFHPTEEKSMKLSGAGVFSPAASRPASPPLPLTDVDLTRSRELDDGGSDVSIGHTSTSSPSTEGSYVLLKGDLGNDRADSVLRRRDGVSASNEA